MAERSSIFDMIGPIMIGPSSSHTGGVARIGRVARHLFGELPQSATITFYNSFSRTYEGHGSDRAIIAGLLNMKTDDERIKTAFDHAKEQNLSYEFKAVFNASSLHPNSIKVYMKNAERQLSVIGISRGGGLISIVDIDGFPCNFSAQSPCLIITSEDLHGRAAFISTVIAQEDCNIATMTINRNGKKGMAKQVVELDSALRPLTLEYMRSIKGIKDIIYLPELDL
jgi:L-serine dehydratase